MPKAAKKKEWDRTKILNAIRQRIVEGEYLPGNKVIENDLAKEFGISRQLARDILQDLESRGLVEKEPNKGTTVRRIDLKTLFEIMELREVIEGLAARLAARNTTAKDWQDLAEEFGAPLEEIVKKTDFEQYLTLVNKFQNRVITAAANSELSIVADRIYGKMLIVQRRTILLPGRLQEGIKEHRDVLNAIMSGNEEKAEELKRKNIRSAFDFMLKYKKWVL